MDNGNLKKVIFYSQKWKFQISLGANWGNAEEIHGGGGGQLNLLF